LIKVNGQSLINFSSNDYLGLANCRALKDRAVAYIDRFGTGASASRLVCGNHAFLAALEEKLARLKGQESALIFNSGFQANVSVIPALADRHSLILADHLCHNSIVQGAILSRAKFLRFKHNDTGHLRYIISKNAPVRGNTLIISESVFSMDGDRSPLAELTDIAAEANALLYIDEAHATGVFGESGMGLSCNGGADVVMGTFGKGCGSFGAYIACPARIREYLINYCSGFIYSTALPPAVIGAIDAALDLVPGMQKERRYLEELGVYLRAGLQRLGGDTGQSSTQIVPLYVGCGERAMSLAEWLQGQGILAIAIRPPTVEAGKARIRLALSALHTHEQIDKLLDAYANWSK
jgi:8-amino-7-oxononanoate synthase